ncbi:MAG TPA: hypothetical protein VGW34_11970 [Allosphingosinicella sp.]|nr:hypothetical protein [Allosphingosinicella sp.]
MRLRNRVRFLLLLPLLLLAVPQAAQAALALQDRPRVTTFQGDTDQRIRQIEEGGIVVPYQSNVGTVSLLVPRDLFRQMLVEAAFTGEIDASDIPGIIRAAARNTRSQLRDLRTYKAGQDAHRALDAASDPRERIGPNYRPPRHAAPPRYDAPQRRAAPPQRDRRRQHVNRREPEDHPHDK